MDRRKLVAAVARKTDYAKWEVNSLLTPLCESILTALKNGEKVALEGFGTFNLKVKKERNWVDPKTKERRVLPGKVQVVFNITPKFAMDEEIASQFIERQTDKK